MDSNEKQDGVEAMGFIIDRFHERMKSLSTHDRLIELATITASAIMVLDKNSRASLMPLMEMIGQKEASESILAHPEIAAIIAAAAIRTALVAEGPVDRTRRPKGPTPAGQILAVVDPDSKPVAIIAEVEMGSVLEVIDDPNKAAKAAEKAYQTATTITTGQAAAVAQWAIKTGVAAKMTPMQRPADA